MAVSQIDLDAMEAAIRGLDDALAGVPQIVSRIRQRLDNVLLSYPDSGRWTYTGNSTWSLQALRDMYQHHLDLAKQVASTTPGLRVVTIDDYQAATDDAKTAAQMITALAEGSPFPDHVPQDLLTLLRENWTNAEFATQLAQQLHPEELAQFLNMLNNGQAQIRSETNLGGVPSFVLTNYNADYADMLDAISGALSLGVSGLSADQQKTFTDKFAAIFTDAPPGSPFPQLMSLVVGRGSWPESFLDTIHQTILDTEGNQGVDYWTTSVDVQVFDPAADPLTGTSTQIEDPMGGVYRSAAMYDPQWFVTTFTGNERMMITVGLDAPITRYDNQGNPYTVDSTPVSVDAALWAAMTRGCDASSFSWLQQGVVDAQVFGLESGVPNTALTDFTNINAHFDYEQAQWDKKSWWEKYHHQVLQYSALVLGIAAMVVPPAGLASASLLVFSSAAGLADAGYYWSEGEEGAAAFEAAFIIVPFMVGNVVKWARLSMTEYETLAAGGKIRLSDWTWATAEDLAKMGVRDPAAALRATYASRWIRGVPSTERIVSLADIRTGGKLTDDSIQAIARASTHNPNARFVILGRYYRGDMRSYEQIADALDATYYDMGTAYDDLAEQLAGVSREEAATQMNKINQAFLDQQIAEGKSFYFTTDPKLAAANSSLSEEWKYLENLGYKLKTDGAFWRMSPP